jgi:DNA excision repair protein ERCC-2
LENKIAEMKDTDADKLRAEYDSLVAGLRSTQEDRDEDAFMANPGMLPGQRKNTIHADIM